MLPLEDNFGDVISKAQRGLKLEDAELAHAAGVPVQELAHAKAGTFSEPVVRKLAPVLGLGVETLVALGKNSWLPKEQPPLSGLRAFTTNYKEVAVNSFMAWDPASKAAVLFDTGADCSGMLEAVRQEGLKPELILLTHTHPDHVARLGELKSATKTNAFVSDLEPIPGAESFQAGRKFTAGALEIETRQTSGHSRGGMTYVISGLGTPVAVVGDSIFASSMGGGMVSYEDALRNNRDKILCLPGETIICPGHGPMTTVAEEKAHNPFFS